MWIVSVGVDGLNAADSGSTDASRPSTSLKPDGAAAERHESRPEQPQLERQHGPGYSSDREQDAERGRPAAGEQHPCLVAPVQSDSFGCRHQERYADTKDGEYDVETERGAHRRSGEGRVVQQSTEKLGARRSAGRAGA